jgi:hypothetical protein
MSRHALGLRDVTEIIQRGKTGLGVTITVTGKLPRLGGQMAPDHDRVLDEIEVIPAKIAGFRDAQPMAIDQ